MQSIADTAEFRRISGLPRRTWGEAEATELARELTSILRTPTGQQTLYPIQAIALYEAGTCGGLVAPMGVGDGKTIVSMLLPAMLDARRPMLFVPGGLVEKTERSRREISRHWRVPTNLRVFSYDMLGRVQAADELSSYRPDVIIADEVHRWKNRRAAGTRRISRYMHDFPETKFCGLSGTFMTKSILDFAHLVLWARKLDSPLPRTAEELEEWSEALDEGVDPFNRRLPGPMTRWCAAGTSERDASAVRQAFRRRLTETPGVVATVGEGQAVGCSIYVRGIVHAVSSETEQHFVRLRNTMTTPDDWQLISGVDVWRHAQELALGLYYRWNPRPPQAWQQARAAWGRFVRETIARSRTFDSELHVANACDAGALPSDVLDAWRAQRPTFTPNVEAVWCDDHAITRCVQWASTPGLVWTEHALFAERLAEVAGVRYYGAGGFATDGHYIQDARPGDSAIASLDANREGKDLQGIWHRNLFVCPPKSASWWEQMIARTHRIGQTADEVTVDVLLGCGEHYDAVMCALAGARAISDLTGKRQKLMMADVTMPDASELPKTTRWARGVEIDEEASLTNLNALFT